MKTIHYWRWLSQLYDSYSYSWTQTQTHVFSPIPNNNTRSWRTCEYERMSYVVCVGWTRRSVCARELWLERGRTALADRDVELGAPFLLPSRSSPVPSSTSSASASSFCSCTHAAAAPVLAASLAVHCSASHTIYSVTYILVLTCTRLHERFGWVWICFALLLLQPFEPTAA